MAGMQQVAGMALQQTLSPQMQQSLNILQAPLTELRSLVDTELRSNPTLEEIPSDKAPPEPDQTSKLDEQWDEYYAQRTPTETWTREALERRQHFLDSQVRPPTLSEHLLEQLRTASWPREDAEIAVEIIGNLDDGGYLRVDINELAVSLDVMPDDVERILLSIQEFDPPGVGSRTLSECLLLQLKAQGRQYSTETRIVRHYLDDLGRKKLGDIAKALDIEIPEVQHAAEVIARLDPMPGRAYAPDTNQIIVPEVIVERDEDESYSVSLNSDEIPKLRICDDYKDMLSGKSKEVRDYLRDKIRGGNFFIKSIQQRQQTILNIAREIVVRQREFMDLGPAHLKPMTMSQVAEVVGVHETTVSRAAAGKFMSTPQGIFEIKYFFTHGYTNSDGETVSNESVRQAIAQIVREENLRHPYSDQDIVKMLSDRGLGVARRTVAKYREQLGILPSHLRKPF